MKTASGFSRSPWRLLAPGKTLGLSSYCANVPQQQPFRLPRLWKRRSWTPTYVVSIRLLDETLVELIEHPIDRTRTAFAVAQGKNLFVTEMFMFQQQLILPFPRQHRLVRGLCLPNGVEPFGSVGQTVRRAGEFLASSFPLPVELQVFLGAYVVHSWVSDTLPISPILILVGPLTVIRPLLEALAAVCRNSLIVDSGCLDGILSLRSKLGATLIFLDHGTLPRLVRHLAHGARKGAVVLSASGPNSIFGPTVLATSRIPDSSTLLADSIVVRVPLSGGLKVNASTFDLAYSAISLRNQLLRFRLESPDELDPHIVEVPSGLTPYAAELLRSFAAPFASDRDLCGRIIQATLECARPAPERIERPLKAVISAALFYFHEYVGSPIVQIDRLLSKGSAPAWAHAARWLHYPDLHILTSLAKGPLRGWGTPTALTENEVGHILADVGLAGVGPKGGNFQLEFTGDIARSLHQLARLFGVVDMDVDAQASLDYHLCPFCREVGFVNEKRLRYFEEVEVPRIREAEHKLAEERARRFAEYKRSGGLLGSIRSRRGADKS